MFDSLNVTNVNNIGDMYAVYVQWYTPPMVETVMDLISVGFDDKMKKARTIHLKRDKALWKMEQEVMDEAFELLDWIL